jgi:flagellar protein FliL
MSDAAAASDDAKPKGGKKKLIIIIVAALLVLGGGGGAALVIMKKQQAAAEEGDEHADAEPAKKKKKDSKPIDPAALPVFLPLDPFTVNLADKDTERYAQIAVTLQLDEAPTAEKIKAYLPAIRNNILMVISHKTAGELLEREGKERLAKEIQRESLAPLGYEMEIEEPEEEAADEEKPKKKKKKAEEPQDFPVIAVHFSNIIIQ